MEPPSKIYLVYFRASEGKLLVVWGLGARLRQSMAAVVGTLGRVAQVTDDKSNWGNQQLITETITYKYAESIHLILKSNVKVLSTINQCNNNRWYRNLMSQQGVSWIK